MLHWPIYTSPPWVRKSELYPLLRSADWQVWIDGRCLVLVSESVGIFCEPFIATTVLYFNYVRWHCLEFSFGIEFHSLHSRARAVLLFVLRDCPELMMTSRALDCNPRNQASWQEERHKEGSVELIGKLRKAAGYLQRLRMWECMFCACNTVLTPWNFGAVFSWRILKLWWLSGIWNLCKYSSAQICEIYEGIRTSRNCENGHNHWSQDLYWPHPSGFA